MPASFFPSASSIPIAAHRLGRAAAAGLLALCAPPLWADTPYTSGVVIERLHADVDIARDGTYVRTTELAKRFDNAQGIEREGKAVLPFQSGSEEVGFVSARVIQPDGREIPVDADKVFVQEAYPFPEAAVFTDYKRKTLVFPDLQPGSVAEATARTVRKEALFPGHFSRLDWRSVHAGALDTRIRFTAPRDMPLYFDAQGATVSREDIGDKVRWTVNMKVDAPRPSEPASPQALDYSPRVAVSSFADDAAFAATYRAMIAGKADVTPEIRALAERLTAGIDAPREQARVLYGWVAVNIRYVAIQIGRGGWVPHAAADVLQQRYGDCKDHVTLLAALLAARGIDSTPVLLNTGLTWWLPAVAMPDSFNHVILYLPALDLYLDSTARYADFGVLPFEDSDKPALRLADGRRVRTPALDAAINRSDIVQTLKLEADGRLHGDTTVRSYGQSAVIDRAGMAQAHRVPDPQLATAVLNGSGEHGSGSFRRPDLDSREGVVETGLRYELTRGLDLSAPGRLPVSRGVRFGGIQSYGRAVDSGATRQSGFLCPAARLSEEQVFELPDSIRVTALPQGRTLVSKDPAFPYAFTTHYTEEGGRIVARRSLEIGSAHSVCDAAAYGGLKALLREIALEYDAALAYAPR